MISTDNTAEEQWKLARHGKFTASSIHKLVAKEGNTTTWGRGALTYIKKTAVDAYTAFEDREVQTYAMKMGKVREPDAYVHYCRLLGFEGMKYFGDGNPLFQPYCPDSGGSPDAVAFRPDGSASFGGEFKCVERDTHWDYLLSIKDALDLKRVEPDYFGQVQFLMMIFKCDLWHWCSFNEFFPFKDQMLIIEVKPDKPYQANLDIRLKMAIKERNRLIEELKNRK